jgi:hypothetical protein
MIQRVFQGGSEEEEYEIVIYSVIGVSAYLMEMFRTIRGILGGFLIRAGEYTQRCSWGGPMTDRK